MALDVQKAAERMLLAQYAPAGVIVDDALNVVHVRGDTGPYLQLAPGEPTYNLLRMAREGLVVGLRTAFVKAKQKKAAITQPVRVKQNGQFKDVNLKVVPINGPVRAGALHFMVLFEDVAPTATPGPIPRGGAKAPAVPKRRRPPGHAALGRIPASNRSLRQPGNTFNRLSRSRKHPRRNSSPPTKRPRRATRNWKPPKRSCSRPTKN